MPYLLAISLRIPWEVHYRVPWVGRCGANTPMCLRVPFPTRGTRSIGSKPQPKKSPSTSVGARAVEWGWEGLYGRPSWGSLLASLHLSHHGRLHRPRPYGSASLLPLGLIG